MYYFWVIEFLWIVCSLEKKALKHKYTGLSFTLLCHMQIIYAGCTVDQIICERSGAAAGGVPNESSATSKGED